MNVRLMGGCLASLWADQDTDSQGSLSVLSGLCPTRRRCEGSLHRSIDNFVDSLYDKPAALREILQPGGDASLWYDRCDVMLCLLRAAAAALH